MDGDLYNREHVLKILAERVREAGGLEAFCKTHYVATTDVRYAEGYAKVTDTLLFALGLERAPEMYQRIGERKQS